MQTGKSHACFVDLKIVSEIHAFGLQLVNLTQRKTVLTFTYTEYLVNTV